MLSRTISKRSAHRTARNVNGIWGKENANEPVHRWLKKNRNGDYELMGK